MISRRNLPRRGGTQRKQRSVGQSTLSNIWKSIEPRIIQIRAGLAQLKGWKFYSTNFLYLENSNSNPTQVKDAPNYLDQLTSVSFPLPRGTTVST